MAGAGSPLVTFAVRTHNSESFVREAMAGALAQTYRPLEVLVSDDASTDATFAVLSEIAARYQGPHTLTLHRNATTLGPGGNVDRIVELSHGELIVFADSDDISLPERSARVVERWQAAGRPSSSLMSRFVVFGREEMLGDERFTMPECPALTMTIPTDRLERLEGFVRGMAPAAFGCAHACTRDLFEIFGPLAVLARGEDTALSFRALLVGEFLIVDHELVRYRLHGGNVSARMRPQRPSLDDLRTLDVEEAGHSASRAALYDVMHDDLDSALAQGLIPLEWHRRLSPEIRRMGRVYRILSRYLAEGWPRRALDFCRLLRLGAGRPRLKLAALRLAPYRIGLRLRRAHLERRRALSDARE